MRYVLRIASICIALVFSSSASVAAHFFEIGDSFTGYFNIDLTSPHRVYTSSPQGVGYFRQIFPSNLLTPIGSITLDVGDQRYITPVELIVAITVSVDPHWQLYASEGGRSIGIYLGGAPNSLTSITPNPLSFYPDARLNFYNMFMDFAGEIETMTQLDADTFAFTGVIDFLIPTVPEPSTWAMLLLGFAGVAFVTHRRRLIAKRA